MLIFGPNLIILFLGWYKTVNIFQEKYFSANTIKNMVFFDKKSEGLDCETWNFSWKQNRSILRKQINLEKTSQNFFSQSSPSLWKCNLKYTNIYCYLFIATNIWCAVLLLVFNSSLSFFSSNPPCSLYEFKLIILWFIHLQLAVINLSQNIYQKWNWTEANLQIVCLK